MNTVELTQVAGYIGAVLAGAAYVPQIWHLIAERCSAGLSRLAFTVWLASSLLVTSHAVATHAAVFIALGLTQITAIAVIIIFAARYAHSRCASHRQTELAATVPARSSGTSDEQPAATSQGTW